MFQLLAVVTAVGAFFQDETKMKVSNAYLMVCLGISVLLRAIYAPFGLVRIALAGMSVPLILLFWFFRQRMMGAGDIKLFAVLGSMMGPEKILYCMLYACVFGSVMAILKMLHFGIFMERMRFLHSFMKGREAIVSTGYRLEGKRAENICFSFPIMMGVLLWSLRVY